MSFNNSRLTFYKQFIPEKKLTGYLETQQNLARKKRAKKMLAQWKAASQRSDLRSKAAATKGTNGKRGRTGSSSNRGAGSSSSRLGGNNKDKETSKAKGTSASVSGGASKAGPGGGKKATAATKTVAEEDGSLTARSDVAQHEGQGGRDR